MKYYRSLILTMALLAVPSITGAQVEVGGLADFVAKNSKEPDITNAAYTGASPLHTTRVRLFFDAPLDGSNAAFVQLLLDNYRMYLYGAYARLGNILGTGLGVHAGVIPNTVGNFGPRSYSNVNPLIGVPLVWVHHSNYIPNMQNPPRTVDQLLGGRDNRSNDGLPILYDNCWNSGVEIFGSRGPIDFSLGALSGSVSKPSIQQYKDVPQFTARVAYVFGPDLVFGLSGFAGPYLYDGLLNDQYPAGKQSEDYLNAGAGYDLALLRGYLEIYSELFYAYWDHPYLPNLEVVSGYVETKYKFLPGWYAASRVCFFEPGEIADSDGDKQHWDYPLKRYEFGIGFHPDRRTIVKAVTQLNRFDFGGHLDSEHYAIQLSVKL